jgi:glyoxylase-like metal-dependent hydrolase (beta-lactamase superfamily II)
MLSFGFSQDLPVDAVVITKENTSRNRNVNVPGNVYMAEGDTELMAYASIVVDTAEGIYVIEPVLHEYRSEAVIGAIRDKFPGKPLLGVIVTHHHMDHIGGLRTYAAETGRVYVGANGEDFIGKALSTRNTVFPDSLDRTGREVEVIGVSEDLTVGAGENAFQLIPYATSHTDDLLLIYFPATRALAIGDIFNGEMADGLTFYNPGTMEILADRAKALKEFIAERELDVEHLLTVHGGAVVAGEIDAYLQAGM